MPAPRRTGATRLTAALSAVVLSAVLSVALALVAGTGPAAQADDGTTGRPATPTAAQQALARAQALFEATPAQLASGGRATGPREATLVLRDLWAVRGRLTGADRAAADRLFARPAASRVACTRRICVHWSPGDVARKDGNKNGRPDYVDKVIRNVDGVHKRYVKAGYRAPKSDRGRGGNDKTDVYLRDVGRQGLYGYCTTDQGQFTSRSNHSAWAYCVLDNDYKSSQFPSNSPIENMQVTAAHEYFHAVQFAYDILEDGWFMEATATWAEDEVYDKVNDNVQYLYSSPLTDPGFPLDAFAGSHQYGDWIFFRYLTEQYPGPKGGLPALVLRIWEAADSVGKGTDRYGVQAIQKVLASRGTSLPAELTDFSADNLFAQSVYDEGAAQGYPEAPPAGRIPLGDGDVASPSKALDHLTSATFRFPTAGTAPGSTLSVTINMPDAARGSQAVITVNTVAGTRERIPVTLDDTGGATAAPVPFGDDLVTSVDVTLVNASTRFRCHRQTDFSCDGEPRDDNLTGATSVEVLAP